ncbi:MAG: type IV secretory system conjugative DNA transfer family protein [Mesorhizobium sp.]|nr:type IV secretory system conjugative DNA transfer family protein [Mesorhizobium sp.]MCO5164612.1 type IV secretory system conjugative DNA transfer family protein [Mesorhizobium sp.]
MISGRSIVAIYLLFCGAMLFALWTLAYGLGLALFFRDGRILSLVISSDPFAPIKQLWTYRDVAVLQTVALGALAVSAAITGMLAYLGLRPRESPLGDASFQTAAELRMRRWFARNGHIFGRFGRNILRASDDRHHLVIGPTRSGKGAGYVIPNALTHKGSMIVTDLKGEIFRATAGYRRKNGNRVYFFSPGSEVTHRYNPLDFIRQERGTRTTDIQNVAAILVPENTDSEHAVWQATSQQVIAGAISYVLESPFYEGRRNFAEINSFFNSGANLQELMKWIKAREPYLSRFTVESFNAYIALSERAAASALLDIQKAMRPFKNERIAAATSVTDMDLRAMQRRPITIYLAPNITDITLVKPLLTLFVQQTMDILTLEHDPNALPVYFLLDEFRQLKRLNEVMTKLPYVAGYRIKLAFIVQDLKNLDEIYGETARHSLLGNCGYQLVLGANDQATADYVSRALGKRTVRYQSESRTIELTGLHRRTKVEQIRERDLMMPQEVRQMPEDKLVLLVEGQKPIYGDKLRFFDTEPFKAAEKFSQAHIPEVPRIEYLPVLPVPAMTDAYAPKEDPDKAAPAGETRQEPAPTPSSSGGVEAAAPKESRARRINASVPLPAPIETAARAETPESPTAVVDQAPDGDAPDATAEALRAEVRKAGQQLVLDLAEYAAKPGPSAKRRRKSVHEIFAATVPDPVELELNTAELPEAGATV